MKIDIRQYAPNQGVSVHVSDKNVTVNEVSERGEKQIYSSGKNSRSAFLNKFISNKLVKKALIITSLATLITVILLSTYNKDSLENRLYNKYYEPMNYNLSGYFIKSTVFELAKTKYIEGDPAIALLLLSELPDDFTYKNEKMLYEALAYMDIEDYETAISNFSNLLNTKENKHFIVTIRWYQGLCYLKVKNIKSAKKSFESILSGDSDYKQKAQRILKKLK